MDIGEEYINSRLSSKPVQGWKCSFSFGTRAYHAQRSWVPSQALKSKATNTQAQT